MSTVKNAIICAAGLGSRLGLSLPKCLVNLGGESILFRQIKSLSQVENVFLVVGHMEEDVIRHAIAIRKDIIIVRNAEYFKNGTLQSILLVSKYLREPFITIDGDLIIRPKSFEKFIKSCSTTCPLIGITPAKTDDAVFVNLSNDSSAKVTGFTRQKGSRYEWAGLAYLKHQHLEDKNEFVYQALEKMLPIKSVTIDCWEIDTQHDLELARNAIESDLLSV